MCDFERYGMLGAQTRKYRRLAAECLWLARGASSPETRARLVDVAQRWLDLANLDAGIEAAEQLDTVQAVIGAELRSLYRLPRSMPARLRDLLARLD
jgi:hypothetical protein